MAFNDESTIDRHESYGMVGISHISSQGSYLAGSDFKHNNFVALRIHRACKHRDLSRDWWGTTGQELIEIFLTEAQLVELIGRPNMGDGVPCTLSRVMGEKQPDPPAPPDRKTQGHQDLKETADKAQQAMREMLALIESGLAEGKIGKNKLNEMAFSLRCQIENFAPNMQFVANSFDKAMDETINRAGIEIEAQVSQMAMRLGLETMKQIGATGPKLITEGEEKSVNT
jgi:hypothetical protein